MIALIRRRISQKAYKALLWVTVFSLVGFSTITSLFKRLGSGSPREIAEVNGYEISPREFRRKTAEEERRLQSFKQRFGDSALAMLQSMGISGKPEELALQSLVHEKLLIETADKLKLRLAPEYVAMKMRDPVFMIQALSDLIPPFAFTEAGIDYPTLFKYLQRQGISVNDFDELVENAIKQHLVLELAQGALYVPEAALKERFIRDYLKKKYALMTIPLSYYSQEVTQESGVKVVKPEELQEFFTQENALRKRYVVPEKRNGITWTFKPQDYGITLSDKEIEEYYQKNKQLFIRKTEQLAEQKNVPQEASYKDLTEVGNEIKQRLEQEKFKKQFAADAQRTIKQAEASPELFDQFVQAHHGQKSNLEHQEKTNSRKIQKLFDLSEGKKAFVLEDGTGSIMQLINREKSYTPSLDTIKDQVLHDLYIQRARERLAGDLVQVSSLTLDQLRDFAKKHGGSVEVTDWLAPDMQSVWSSLEKRGFPGQAMMAMTVTGAHADLLTPEAGQYAQAIEIEPFDSARFNERKNDLWRALYAEEAQQFSYGLIASLQKNATIKINSSAVRY